MNSIRLLAVIAIYFCTMIGWFILGGSIAVRTDEKSVQSRDRVEGIWGGEHMQLHPTFRYLETRIDTVTEAKTTDGKVVTTRRFDTRAIPVAVTESSSKITARLDVEYRQKGLLWHTLYSVAFAADYALVNPTDVERDMEIRFYFPSKTSMYDNFLFQADGKDLTAQQEVDEESRIWTATLRMQPRQSSVITIRYRSQGMGKWSYAFAAGVNRVRNFDLQITTGFKEFDIPEGGVSATERTETEEGWNLRWKYDDVISQLRIALDMPQKLNPGPTAQRISFFAPVSLLFFFTILIIVSSIRKQAFHPMHYFFLAAAFFSFHLFFAYLVDHLALGTAFALSSLTSVLLVWTYMRKVASEAFAIRVVVPTQIVYLILFSYSFFFEGYTGLTVTIGAIATLFVLMQMTARTDWNQVFQKRP